MTLTELAESLHVRRQDGESYYTYLVQVGDAYLSTLTADDTSRVVVDALVNALLEQRNLNVGIINENNGLKKQLQEAQNSPYGKRTDATTPLDESRDPSKTFHYDLDPRARAVIRNGAYILTIQPSDP